MKPLIFSVLAMLLLQSCAKSDDASGEVPPANTIRINANDYTVTDDFRYVSDSMIFVSGTKAAGTAGIQIEFGERLQVGDYPVAAYPPSGHQAAFIAVADSNGLERAYVSTGAGSATLSVSGSPGSYRFVLRPAQGANQPSGMLATVSANVSQK